MHITNVDGCESDPDRAYAVNALGPRFLAIAGSRIGAHVVHVSTDYVFDGTAGRPYSEWDDTNPISHYGRSKLGGEIEVARHASSWAIARTAWVFGQRGKDFVQLALDAAAGADYGFVDDQTGSPSYAPDVAGVLVRARARAGVGAVPRGQRGRVHPLPDGGRRAGAARPRSVAAQGRLDGRSRPPGAAARSSARCRTSRSPLPGSPRLRHYRDALAEYLAEPEADAR